MRRFNLFRILKYAIGIAALAICGLVALFWVEFILPMQKHQKRIKTAEAIFASYKEADWIDLYNQCLPLFALKDIYRKDFPPRVRQLNPYSADKMFGGDAIEMHWTGGFDDQPLLLYIFRRPVQFYEDGLPDPAGIKIVGPDYLPERPYIRK
jgi:hypothetical protein